MSLISQDIIKKFNSTIKNLECFHESFNLVNFMIQPHIMHINREAAGTKSLPEYKLHSHRTFEFSILLKGRMKYQFDGREVIVSDNDFTVISPDTPHSWIALQESVIFSIMLFIQCHGNGARENMNDLKNSIERYKYVIRDFISVADVCSDIIHEVQAHETGFDEKIQCLVRGIFIEVMRKLLPNHKTELRTSRIPPQRGNVNASVMELIQFYVQDNISRKISMSEISAYIGKSVNQTCNIFKKNRGITIHEYITSIRLQTSCELLLNTDRLLQDIATEVGYDDTDYFCRVFRKHMGMTPTQYRRENN